MAVFPDSPNIFNPIHEDDIIRMLPALVEAASVPATIVNVGGDETVSIQEWTNFLAELVGKTATFDETTETIDSVTVDNTKRREIAGPTTVGWQDGFRRMFEARHAGAAV